MALFYLLSALVLGAAIVRRIPFALYRFEAVAMSVVLGLLSWTWLSFLLALILPYDVALPIVVTVSVGATIALWPGGGVKSWRPLEGGKAAWGVWGAATALTGIVLTRLFWTHSLTQDKDGIWTGGSTWGDFGVHSAIVNHINAATHLPTDLPIAAGEKLTYPFLIDMLSAFYVQGGMSLHAALFWPGVLLALALCQLMISVGLRLFQRISVGVGGLALALTMASAAGTWQAWSDWRHSGKGLFSFLGKLPSDYSEILDKNAHVTNLVADALLPQRAILFGIGAGLIALTFMYEAREQKDTRLFWPAAVIVGLMPMAHAHTFLAGMAFFAALAIEAAWRSRSIPKAHLAPIGLALVLAAPQLIWQQAANGRGTGGRFRFGWMWEHGHSLLGYWWVNFGLIGILLIAIPFLLRRHRQLIWFLPMLALFLIAEVYAFQPFEYDNLKLITWAYIIGGFFIAYLASELYRRNRLFLALLIPLGIFVMTPGVLSITREFQLRWQFASPDDIAMADWVRDNTPVDSVFASDDRSNNPVSTLAGRNLVEGFTGWLYSYNIPYTDRNAAVKAAFAGKFEDPLLQRYSADYLIVAATEDPQWAVDENALTQRQANLAWSNATWRVYRLH